MTDIKVDEFLEQVDPIIAETFTTQPSLQGSDLRFASRVVKYGQT